MIDNFIGISERIQQQLQQKGLRQIDLCRLTGLSRNAVSLYIAQKRVPDSLSAYKIAMALGVSMEWLLAGNTTNDDTAINSDPADSGIAQVTDRERDLILMYRQLSENDQSDAYDIIEMKYKRALKQIGRSLCYQNENATETNDRLA